MQQITLAMPPNSHPPVSDCQATVRRTDLPENHFDLLHAANTLMENCETDPSITIDDGLACLDRGGLVTEMGARILYVLTGRDGLHRRGAGYKGLPFHTDKSNWLAYIADQQNRG